MASLKNKIAAQAAAKDRPKPVSGVIETIHASTAASAATKFAHKQHGGPQALQWVDEEAGTFKLLGRSDPRVYRVVQFGREWVIKAA